MPRRSLSLPPGESTVTSSSAEGSVQIAHDATLHGIPARASIIEDSEAPRISRGRFSPQLEIVRDGKEIFRRQAAILPPDREPGDTDPRYSSGPGRSIPSQASFSDYDLVPSDSISNHGSGSNGNSMHNDGSSSHETSLRAKHFPVSLYLSTSKSYPTHGRYVSNEYYDPRHRASPSFIEPNEDGARNKNKADLKHDLEVYRDVRVPRVPRSAGGNGTDSRPEAYDDDFEEPFMARTDSHSETSSHHVHYDHSHDTDDSGREWDLIED